MRPEMVLRAAVLALTVTAASGCGTVLGNDEYAAERERLDDARKVWATQGWDSYTFVLQRLCFCGGGTEPGEVVVQSGVRVSVTSVQTGEPIPEAWQQYYLTVPELFDFIEDAIDREAHSIDVTYATGSGYPTHIAIDYVENVIDEEMAFQASALTPTG
jgi:hypothetical protein